MDGALLQAAGGDSAAPARERGCGGVGELPGGEVKPAVGFI